MRTVDIENPPPTNTAAPTIAGNLSGRTAQGETLTANHGTWTTVSSPTYTYQWQDCDSSGENCVDVTNGGGASTGTGQTYKIQASDAGHKIEVVVTATDNGGTSSASSTATNSVASGYYCSDIYVGSENGAWSSAGNWSNGAAPTSSEVACISDGTTVDSNNGADTAQRVLGGNVLSSGDLALTATNEQGASELETLTLDGGILSVSGKLEVSSAINMPIQSSIAGGGDFVIKSGATASLNSSNNAECSNGQLSIRGSGTTLTNNGTLQFGSSATETNGYISFEEGSSLQNAGVFKDTIENHSGHGCGEQFSVTSGGTFTNTSSGTLVKTAGSGTTAIGAAFVNSGSVRAEHGTLSFSGGITGTAGTWTAESGAVIIPTQNGTATFSGGSWTGAGTFNLDAGTLSVPAEATLPVSANLELSGGSLEVAGELEVSTALDLVHQIFISGGGKLVVAHGATASLNASNSEECSAGQFGFSGSGTTLVNNGTLQFGSSGTDHNGKLELGTGTAWQNNGVFKDDVENESGHGCGNTPSVIGPGGLTNTGTLVKNAGTHTTTISAPLTNSGNVETESGTFSFEGGGSSNGGVWNAPSSTGISFVGHGMNLGGDHLAGSGVFSVANSGTVQTKNVVTSGGPTLAVSGNATLEVAEGTLSVPVLDLNEANLVVPTTLEVGSALNTTASAHLSGGGSLTIKSGAVASLNSGNAEPCYNIELEGSNTTLTNDGTFQFGSEGTARNGRIALRNGTKIDNAGTFRATAENESGHGCGNDPGLSGEGTAEFVNTGSLVKDVGTGNSIGAIPISNSGTISATTGSLSLTKGGSSSNGSWHASSGSSVGLSGGVFSLSGDVLNGPGSYVISNATTAVHNVSAASNPTVVVGGATLEVSEGNLSLPNLTTGSGGTTSILKTSGAITVGNAFDSAGNTEINGGGSLVIGPSAVADLNSENSEECYNTQLSNSGTTFVNEGTLQSGPSANNKYGRILLESGTTLRNTGTFNDSIENESGHGCGNSSSVIGSGNFVNTGTFEKTSGSAASSVGSIFTNQGAVSNSSGVLSFSGGSDPAVCATGSWANSGTELELERGTYYIPHSVDLSGVTVNSEAHVEECSSAPINSSPPVVSGTPDVGNTLSVSNGSWEGAPAPSFSYQWQRCNSEGGECADIAGATSSAYVVLSEDVGHQLLAVVTASNTGGESSASSEPVGPAVGVAPSNSAAPSISGSAHTGGALHANVGTWAGSTPISYDYQWQLCSSSGEECAEISGATESSYTLLSEDEGHKLVVVVNATNAYGGPVEATSTPSSLIGAALTDSWSAPESIDSNALTAVSCYSSSFCMAVDSSNGARTSVNPIGGAGEWASSTADNSGLTAVSCPSTSFCLANTSGYTELASVSGSSASWTNSGADGGNFNGNACGSNSFCIHIEGSGDRIDYSSNPTSSGSWGPSLSIGFNGKGASCSPGTTATSGLCVVVGASGDMSYATEPGVSWAGATTIDGSNTLTSVSCPSASLCVAVDSSGNALVSTNPTGGPSAWTSASIDSGNSLTSVSCSATEFCVAVDNAGNALVSSDNGASWGSPEAIDSGHSLTGVSCAAEGELCAAVDNAGRVTVYADYSNSAPHNTVAPTITGTAQTTYLLDAHRGTWSGYPSPTFSYQWERCNSEGADCASISGAMGESYEPGNEDIGYTLRVVVTAKNEFESEAHEVSVESAATAVVTEAEVRPRNTVLPTITGVDKVGETLTANIGTWSGTPPITYTYEWYRCNSLGSNCSEISGATNETYTLQHADAGHTLRISVEAENNAGREWEESEATPVIAHSAAEEAESEHEFSTSRFSSPITADAGHSLTGISCSSSTFCVAVDSAGQIVASTSPGTEGSWTVEQSGLAELVAVSCAPGTTATSGLCMAIGSDNAYTSTDPSGGEGSWVAAATPPNGGDRGVVCPTAGYCLISTAGGHVDIGTVSGTSVTWENNANNGGGFEDITCGSVGFCAHIDGGSVDYTSNPTSNVSWNSASPHLEARVVSCAPGTTESSGICVAASEEGEVSVATDPSGTWAATDADATRDIHAVSCASTTLCVAVDGSGAAVISEAPSSWGAPEDIDGSDSLNGVSCVETFCTAVDSEGNVVTYSATESAPVNTVAPTLPGSEYTGGTLTVENGTWTSASPITYSYHWELCENFEVSTCTTEVENEAHEPYTGKEYTTPISDAGKFIVGVVKAENAVGATEAYTEVVKIYEPAPVNTVAPSLSGEFTPGGVVDIHDGTWTSETPIEFSYYVLACPAQELNGECEFVTNGEAAEGETPTYTLPESVSGKDLILFVEAFNHEEEGTAQSGFYEVGSSPVNTVAPSVTGTAHYGDVLTANPGTWTGSPAPTFTYQWLLCDGEGNSCEGIAGATETTYTLTSEDVGHTLKVEVVGSNTSGSSDATSSATSAVTGAAPVNTAIPTVSGTAIFGDTLTATNGTWTGSPTPTFTYQWQRCSSSGGECADVSGATSSTYSLGSADVEHRLRIRVTATNISGSLSRFSTVTSVVGKIPGTPSTPTLSTNAPAYGTALTSSEGAGSTGGYPAPTYLYQWQRCVTTEEGSCADISGATHLSYTPQEADVGKYLRVGVAATNSVGSSATAYSAETSEGVTGVSPTKPEKPAVNAFRPAVGWHVKAVNVGGSSGVPVPTYIYQWEICTTKTMGSCSVVNGATSATYMPTRADLEKYLRVRVEAENSTGTWVDPSEPEFSPPAGPIDEEGSVVCENVSPAPGGAAPTGPATACTEVEEAVSGSALTLTAPEATDVEATTLSHKDQIGAYSIPETTGDNTGTGHGWNETISQTAFTSGAHTIGSNTGSGELFEQTTGAGKVGKESGNTGAAVTQVGYVDSVENTDTNPMETEAPVSIPLNVPIPTTSHSATAGDSPSVVFQTADKETGLGNFIITPTISFDLPADTYAGSYTAITEVDLSTGP